MLRALKLHRTQDLVDHVHLMMSHSDVAALAPTVVAIADEGDEVAARLLAETADSLVELAEAAANRVRTDRAGLMDAAFVGGLARRPQIRQLVEKRLKGSTVCHWREPVATAAVGAVVLGGSRTGHLAGWDDDTLDRMIAATEEQ